MILRSSRKAQDGTKAATLVAIIAGLIILYILFIPPSQREEILNITNESAADGSNVTIAPSQTLLLVHPGLLEYVSATEYEKSIPPLTLLVSTEATTLKTAEAISIKNSWFSNKFYNLTFSVGDLQNTRNVLFSFNVEDSKGELIIELNGQTIYQKEPQEHNVALILPSDALSSKNSLMIKSASTGFAFWRTNSHRLSGLKIIADVTDISKRKSQSSFVLSSAESSNLETARLRFYVDCASKQELGKLSVAINNQEVYSQIPICGEIVSQQISTNILTGGENTIVFSTEFEKPTMAYYQIDNILIRLSLKEPLPLTYYFDLNSTNFNAVTAGTRNLIVEMLFTDSSTRKKADVYINGIKTGLETRERNYTRVISSFAKQGNNAIKIEPLSTFEIVDLIVKLE